MHDRQKTAAKIGQDVMPDDRCLLAYNVCHRHRLFTVAGKSFQTSGPGTQSQMYISRSELRYFTPFKNAKAVNEGESTDFAYFYPKIGCHGRFPCTIEIRG